jgi:hypothetical protein
MAKMKRAKLLIVGLFFLLSIALVFGLPTTYNPFTGKLDYYGLLSQNCTAGQLMWGLLGNGTIVCAVDQAVGGMDYTNLALTNQSNTFEGNLTIEEILRVLGIGNFSGKVYIDNGTDISSWPSILNETDLVKSVNATANIQNLGFYTKVQTDNNLTLYLLLTDQRYNDTGKINSVNTTLNLVATNASINHTSIVFINQNSTWDNNWMNIWGYNQTTATYNLYNDIWSSTSNLTYGGFISFNHSSLISNLTNGDCSAGSLVIGVQSNGTVLCATDTGELRNYFNQQLNITSNAQFNTVDAALWVSSQTLTSNNLLVDYLVEAGEAFVFMGEPSDIEERMESLIDGIIRVVAHLRIEGQINASSMIYYNNGTPITIFNDTSLALSINASSASFNTTPNIQNLYNNTLKQYAAPNTTVGIELLFNSTMFGYAAPNTTAGIQSLINGTGIYSTPLTINTTLNIQVLYNSTAMQIASEYQEVTNTTIASINVTANIQKLLNGAGMNFSKVNATEINITGNGNNPHLYFGKGGYIYDNGTTTIIGHS